MEKEIYRSIVKDTQMAYIIVSCRYNYHNKYTNIKVLEYNNEFTRMLRILTQNNILNGDIIEAIINCWITNTFQKEDFNRLVNEIIELKHKKIKIDINLKNKALIADIHFSDNCFIVVCSYIYNLKETDNLRVLNWEKDLNGVYKKSYYTNGKISNKNMSITGKKDSDVWSKDELAKLKENELQVINENSVKTFFHILTNEKGKKFYYETTLWPLVDYDNNLIGVKGCSIEIDDKVDYSSIIEQDTENIEEIIKCFNIVFIVTDDKKALYINSSFEKVFERKPDELYEDISKLDNYFIGETLDNGEIQYKKNLNVYNQGNRKLKLSSNKEKWISYNMLTIKNSKKETLKRIISILDITERKRMQEKETQLRLNFFINLSHELRTPINVITSTVQLARLNLDKINSEEKDKFCRYIDIVEDNSWRLLKLINNLLDSTKTNEGFVKFNPINADIVEFTENICDSVAEYVKFNKMNLIFDTNKEEDLVLFDPDIIERVILNLLSNAVKFNKVKGNIYVDVYISESNITISVKDEGIGIPKEKLNFIFKRFEQISNENSTQKKGSGIGLYLVSSLVKLHGGTINVESVPNEGSKFEISIPRNVLKIKTEEEREKYILETNNYLNNINDRIGIEFSDIN